MEHGPNSPADFIDLQRYPITDLDSEKGLQLVEHVRARLREGCLCSLPGFVHPAALSRMVREAEALAQLAYPGPTEASPYFFNYGTEQLSFLPADHPRQRKTPRNLKQVAYDLIPAASAIYQLYNWDGIPHFLATVLRIPEVYHSADPYQALNISMMEDGGCQQWHFDTNEVNTTLLLQAPEAGGEFEYVPLIRTAENENYEAVKRILDGERAGVVQLRQEPGMLVLFKGHHSLHRVAPMRGQVRRIQTILGYNTRPGVVGSRESTILHYGPRVSAA